MRMLCSPRAIALSAVLSVLAAASDVFAAYTSTVVSGSPNVATMTGDAAADTLTIDQAGGLLRHNRFTAGDPGFASDFDFDSTVAGDQTLSATADVININAGAGNDTISFANGIDIRGFIDGGPDTDTLDYAAYTTAIRVNLGLSTTGLNATLGADQEVSPTASVATGTATISNYNITIRTFDINVTVSNLPPGDVIGFHIHQAPVGVEGPLIIDLQALAPLVPDGMGGFTFTAIGVTLPAGNDAPAGNEAAFLGGGTYVDIHTVAFPAGAIRGQNFSGGNNISLMTGVATGTAAIVDIETVTGGTAGDSLVGKDAANTLNGGPGADWIVGGPGADTLNGDAGDDVLVWNNGDGSDTMDGTADNDTVQVNGSPTANDVFTISASGARIDFARQSPGPFDLSIGTTETLIVNGLSGTDTFFVGDLSTVTTLTTLNLNGFAGNDTFIYPSSTTGAKTYNVSGGTDADELVGPPAGGGTTWNVTAANAGNVAGLVASFRFIETLRGAAFPDTFNVKAFANAPISLFGGGFSASDTVNYDAEGRTVSGDTTPPDGIIQSPGVSPVTFAEMQTINILNPFVAPPPPTPTPPPANTPPTISGIPNQTINANTSTGALSFTVGDSQTPAGSLAVSASSSNATLVPPGNIVLGGGGSNRTITVTPATNRAGTATIIVTVSDGELSASTSFVLTVLDPTTVQPPTNLRVSDVTGNLVTFRFESPTFGPPPTGFSLEGGLNPNEVLASIATGSTSPIFSVLVPTGSFYARMIATRGAERSAPSNEIRIFVNVPVPPSAPDTFRAAANGNTLVLSWRNTFEGGTLTGLELDASGTVNGTLPLGRSETVTFNNVPAGPFTLRLRSTNGAGSSAATAPLNVTIPAACPGPPQVPSNVLAYRVGNTVFIVWDPPTGGPAVSSYVVFVSGSFVGSFQTTTRSLSGQVGAGAYTITVVALNPCGASPGSPSQTVVVP